MTSEEIKRQVREILAQGPQMPGADYRYALELLFELVCGLEDVVENGIRRAAPKLLGGLTND